MDAHVPQRPPLGRLIRRACVLAALLASTAVQAAEAAPLCSAAFVDAAAASLRHKLTSRSLRDCRELPSSPGRAAVAMLSPGAAGKPAWALDFAIVQAGGELAHHLHRTDGNVRSGEKLVGVKIDTGRFDLAPGVRAIGLRVQRKVPDQLVYSAGDVTTLELFVAEDKTLRSVLRELEVASARGGGEVIDCSDVKFTTTRVLDLGTGSTLGMRDLVVRRRGTGISENRKDELCEPFDGKPYLATAVLRYNGNQYPVPAPADE